PLEVITELEPERTNRVVEALILIEHLLAGRGYVEGVVVVHEAFVWGTEDADEDVLEHALTLEEVVLDVALLDTGEALLEGDEDLPAVERLRAVGDQGLLVEALDHEAPELEADRILVLAVDHEVVMGGDRLEVGGLVDVGAHVVLVGEDRRGPGQLLQGELLSHLRQRQGYARAQADEVAHHRHECALAVVAASGVEPRRLVPGDVGAQGGADDLPE